MNSSTNSKSNFKQVLLWLAVVAVTAATYFASTYSSFSSQVKAIIWIGWFLVTGMLVFFTNKGKQIFEFGNEAKTELQKVVWPTRQETVQTTSIVMAMVAVTGFILWGI